MISDFIIIDVKGRPYLYNEIDIINTDEQLRIKNFTKKGATTGNITRFLK